ncbi:hypothetical protein G7Y89_g2970 [Cudoniella acicularis]|uniref:DUF7730 domain-containing protein n=1 Tax=Cudoniella acicularis TaxID=354080 RepID=A0A8H4W614_9HELO|nr:hypothetical protein G7Y89_g2970 [Cudoniella acicularis]
MSSTFLRLPREIRDLIYDCIFSPTGAVVLLDDTGAFPNTGPVRPCFTLNRRKGVKFGIIPLDTASHDFLYDNEINISFLRTCKQIYEESKHILWQENTLRIKRNDPPYLAQWSGLIPQLTHHLRHLEVDLDETECTHTGLPLGPSMDAFIDLVRGTNLKTVTLVLPHNGPKSLFTMLCEWFWQEYMWLISLDDDWSDDDWLDDDGFKVCLGLYTDEAPHIDMFPSRVDKIAIDTGMPRRLLKKKDYLDRHLEFHPGRMARQLHKTFGGEVWMDGVLCFKDGIKCHEIFELTAAEQRGLNALQSVTEAMGSDLDPTGSDIEVIE